MQTDKDHFAEYMSSCLRMVCSFDKSEIEYYRRYFKKNFYGYLPKDKNAHIIDVGCGAGYFLDFLKKEEYNNFIGIDISKENVDFCVSQGLNAIESNVFDFLENRKEVFNCAVLNFVLEHIDKKNIIKLLCLMKERLAQNGIIIILTNNANNPITSSYTRYLDFTHEISFTEVSLVQALGIAGFRKAKVLPSDMFVLENPIINSLATLAVFWLNKIFRFLFLLYGSKNAHIFTQQIIGIAYK